MEGTYILLKAGRGNLDVNMLKSLIAHCTRGYHIIYIYIYIYIYYTFKYIYLLSRWINWNRPIQRSLTNMTGNISKLVDNISKFNSIQDETVIKSFNPQSSVRFPGRTVSRRGHNRKFDCRSGYIMEGAV
jgi:hypothetical protein